MSRLAIALTLLLAGCVNGDLVLQVIDVSGDVASPESGDVHLELHHAERGDGELAHPLGPIDALTLDSPGPFEHELLYPSSEGRGLVVYAWQDLDGDGVLCAPGADPEPVGAAWFDEIPEDAFALSVELTLDVECLGPERL